MEKRRSGSSVSQVFRFRDLLHTPFARTGFLRLLRCNLQIVASGDDGEEKNQETGDGDDESSARKIGPPPYPHTK